MNDWSVLHVVSVVLLCFVAIGVLRFVVAFIAWMIIIWNARR